MQKLNVFSLSTEKLLISINIFYIISFFKNYSYHQFKIDPYFCDPTLSKILGLGGITDSVMPE